MRATVVISVSAKTKNLLYNKSREDDALRVIYTFTMPAYPWAFHRAHTGFTWAPYGNMGPAWTPCGHPGRV